MPAEIKFIKTKNGVMAVHRHEGYVPENKDAFQKIREPRTWFVGWIRRAADNWRQYHLQGYGPSCPICGVIYPEAKELEGLYQEAEKAGISDELQYRD